MKKPILFLALGRALGMPTAQAADITQLDEVVVTGVRISRPLIVETDPRHPRQPAPAADGGSLLKSIPGFSASRKGGSAADPLLRGLGGSRLAILADDGFVYGGCGGRMDPPTAYLFPDAYDRLEVIKGPQSVRFGSGLISGAVNFQRQPPHLQHASTEVRASLLAGSAERLDGYLEAMTGNRNAYLRAISSHTQGGDYRDGNGDKVHAAFEKRSDTLALGLTPGDDTRLELNVDRSRGHAAYADRSMDGSKFDRDAVAVKLEQQAISDWLEALRLQASHSYVDHVMDNFRLRQSSGMAMLSNPDRETDSSKLEAELALGQLALTLGASHQEDRHRSRSGTTFDSQPWLPDQHFRGSGVFAEARYPLAASSQLIGGLRQDRVLAIYEQDTSSTRSQQYTMHSGFLRLEQQLGSWQPFVALGLAERAPDYWERNRSKLLGTERNVQLDAGARYEAGKLQGGISAYASRMDDFILIDGSSARNIDATRAGLEADLNWRFAPAWKLGGTLAYAWGRNDSDARPLAQTPPLEAGLNLGWDNGSYAVGALLRLVARQNRVAAGQGNIIGTDIGTSPGFGVLSLHAGWRASKQLHFTAGLDNVLNKTYAEHVSKAGAMVSGYTRTTRVNEPGRALWLKLQGQWGS